MSERTIKICQDVSVSINSKPFQEYTVIRIMDNIVTMAANELGDEVYNVMIKLHPTPASESDTRPVNYKPIKNTMNNLQKQFEKTGLKSVIKFKGYTVEYTQCLEKKLMDIQNSTKPQRQPLDGEPIEDSITERAMLALDNYLNAGSKEERAKASEGAKSLYKEYYGMDYMNRNERYL